MSEFLCVCLNMAESEREERREVIFEVMCMEEWEILHGYPLDNNEVACIKSTLPFPLGLGYWAENMEEKKEIWAFCS